MASPTTTPDRPIPRDRPRVMLEGEVLYRDRQKWRSRWCRIVKKQTAGAAHTQLLIFGSGRPADALATPSEAHSLADFCGLDAGQALEGQDNVLSIITVHISYTLAFTSPRELDSWTRMLRSELGCEWTFNVRVLPTQNKIRPGDATLRFFPAYFSLTAGNPCSCLGYWLHNQLRRYGGSSGFSFEAGSKCYGGAGVYRLECKDGPKIKDLFDRVANNRPLPDPPRRLTSSSWHSTSGDSDPGQSRSPLSPLPSSYYKDPGSLYTLPPSVNGGDNTSVQPHTPPSGPRLRSSEGTSSMSPPDERPQLPPPQLKPAKQAEPDSNYENLNSAYDYVSIPAPRPIPEQDLKYVQVFKGGELAGQRQEGSVGLHGGGSAVGGSADKTVYGIVDMEKTQSLSSAISSQRHERSRPPGSG